MIKFFIYLFLKRGGHVGDKLYHIIGMKLTQTFDKWEGCLKALHRIHQVGTHPIAIILDSGRAHAPYPFGPFSLISNTNNFSSLLTWTFSPTPHPLSHATQQSPSLLQQNNNNTTHSHTYTTSLQHHPSYFLTLQHSWA